MSVIPHQWLRCACGKRRAAGKVMCRGCEAAAAGHPYSPGPWSTGRGMFEVIMDAKDRPVCRLSVVDYRNSEQIGRPIDEELANARLIALGPTMLKMCREALEALYNLRPSFRERECANGGGCGACTVCDLRTVIAQGEKR